MFNILLGFVQTKMKNPKGDIVVSGSRIDGFREGAGGGGGGGACGLWGSDGSTTLSCAGDCGTTLDGSGILCSRQSE